MIKLEKEIFLRKRIEILEDRLDIAKRKMRS